MRSTRKRFLAAAAAPLVFLAACSPNDGDGDAGSTASPGDDAGATTAPGDDAAATSLGPPTDLAEVSVETEEDSPVLTWNDAPFAEGDLPFVSDETQIEQVEAGDGDTVEEGHEVQLRYLTINGTNGEELVNTFAEDAAVTMNLADESIFPAFRDNLPGTLVGEQVLMAIPPTDAFGEMGQPELGVGPQDTMIFYLEVASTGEPLTQAEGTEVEPEEGLPAVETDGQSAALIDVEGAEPPEELVIQPLIEGEGPEVQAGQLIRVHYTGVKLSDGEQFDASYDRGEPTEFPIGVGQVIPGWDDGLVGQPVGSRVLLVIPAEQAYGPAPEETEGETAAPGNELAGEDLVFVVDILGAY